MGSDEDSVKGGKEDEDSVKGVKMMKRMLMKMRVVGVGYKYGNKEHIGKDVIADTVHTNTHTYIHTHQQN